MQRPRAIIIGGSLGGLFAANLLRSAGWDAVVYERTETDLSGRGAGLGTRDELFSIMRRIGISAEHAAGVHIRSRLCLDGDGNVECEVPISSVATAWDRVYRALKAALPPEHYCAGIEFRRLEQQAGVVSAYFADGLRVDGELLIGADGIHSSVRPQLSATATPRYAGYVGWRGAADVAHIPPELHDLVLSHMNFCFPEGELALSMPMPATAPAEKPNRVQITWFRPTRKTELRQLCTDERGRYHGLTIPPPLIRNELIAELRSRADILAPQMATLFRAVRQPLLQPIFDLESPRLVFGRVLLLGDAAFVARPHVGTGVTKAALDAAALADALFAHGMDVEAALAEYERDRMAFGTQLVARGRHLGAYLEAQLVPRERRDKRQLYRRPITVLQQFGAAGEAVSADSIHCRV